MIASGTIPQEFFFGYICSRPVDMFIGIWAHPAGEHSHLRSVIKLSNHQPSSLLPISPRVLWWITWPCVEQLHGYHHLADGKGRLGLFAKKPQTLAFEHLTRRVYIISITMRTALDDSFPGEPEISIVFTLISTSKNKLLFYEDQKEKHFRI